MALSIQLCTCKGSKRLQIKCKCNQVGTIIFHNPARISEFEVNLAKLGDGRVESPTVMVGDYNNKTKNSVKIGPY